MNILEWNTRYGISMKKLRRMESDGVLKIDPNPDWWARTISDIKKGKMSARSVALAFKFPNVLEKFVCLTLGNRKVIDAHFSRAGLPAANIPATRLSTITFGAAENEKRFVTLFIEALQTLIPETPVRHEYVAVRATTVLRNRFPNKS